VKKKTRVDGNRYRVFCARRGFFSFRPLVPKSHDIMPLLQPLLAREILRGMHAYKIETNCVLEVFSRDSLLVEARCRSFSKDKYVYNPN